MDMMRSSCRCRHMCGHHVGVDMMRSTCRYSGCLVLRIWVVSCVELLWEVGSSSKHFNNSFFAHANVSLVKVVRCNSCSCLDL